MKRTVMRVRTSSYAHLHFVGTGGGISNVGSIGDDFAVLNNDNDFVFQICMNKD